MSCSRPICRTVPLIPTKDGTMGTKTSPSHVHHLHSLWDSLPKALLGLARHVREPGTLPALPCPDLPVRSVALSRRPNRHIHLSWTARLRSCPSDSQTLFQHSPKKKKELTWLTLKALCIHCCFCLTTNSGEKSPLLLFFLLFFLHLFLGHFVYPLHLCLCLVTFA